MYLYLYHSGMQERESNKTRTNSPDFSDRMAIRALKDFCEREKLALTEEKLNQVIILRDEKGKPFFSIPEARSYKSGIRTESGEFPVHYSVSHSGEWWGCLMAKEHVGFDLEVGRDKINYERLAKRFFTDEEYDFVVSGGLEAFFELWVRKEAYVKFKGTGLAEGLNSFSVVQNSTFTDWIVAQSGDRERICFLRPCPIGNNLKAAYCCISGALVNDIIKFND